MQSPIERILKAEETYWKALVSRMTCCNCGQLIRGENPDKNALMRDHFKVCVS